MTINLYKAVNGDESIVIYIFAESMEEAQGYLNQEIEDNYDEEYAEHIEIQVIPFLKGIIDSYNFIDF